MKNIEKNFKELEKCIDVLYLGSSYALEDFLVQPIIIMGCERALILGVNIIKNISSELLDGRFKDKAIEKLIKNKVLPKTLGEALIKYEKLFCTTSNKQSFYNQNELYTKLQEYILNFQLFRKYVLEYVV